MVMDMWICGYKCYWDVVNRYHCFLEGVLHIILKNYEQNCKLDCNVMHDGAILFN